MADIISLLPDHVVNQIAAGEVIQRPSSVVKELIENSIDAQASEIKLLISGTGKTIIQVIDNGIGMSPADVRLAFERHATSKIKSADDLFSITSRGFRGRLWLPSQLLLMWRYIPKGKMTKWELVLKFQEAK